MAWRWPLAIRCDHTESPWQGLQQPVLLSSTWAVWLGGPQTLLHREMGKEYQIILHQTLNLYIINNL